MLSISEVERAVPANLKASVTQELVDKVNQLTSDPLAAEAIRDNFVSYSIVLKEGRYKLEDYMNAVAYVSFKVMGYTNQDSYARTFPQRYQKLVAAQVSAKDISAYVAAYNKNKLVTAVLEQSMVPFWLLNRDARQQAVSTLVDLMQNAQSEKVKGDAAANLLAHLKEPETKKVELNLGSVDASGLGELNATLVKLAEQQKSLIEQGVSTKTIAHADIIDAEVVK